MIQREERIGGQRLILGDCIKVLPLIGRVDAVVTDPPYGFLKGSSGHGSGKLKARALNVGNTQWDSAPDAGVLSAVLGMAPDCIMWGGNYFDLPPCRGFLIWDKQQPWPNFSAAEFAWTSLDRPSGIFRLSASRGDKGESNTHPTVKPLELMEWCLGFLPDARTILDPFMGSGTTLVACQRLGRSGIGIELDPDYFDIACRRVEEATRQPDMFIAPPPPPPQQTEIDL